MAKSDMASDGVQSAGESAETLRYLQNVYQNRYMVIVGEINQLAENIKDISSSQKTLENSDKIAKSDALIPIGAAVYTKATLKEFTSAIIGVGGGYLIEKNTDEAKAFIAKKLERTTKALNTLMKQKADIEGAILDISYRMDALASAGN